MAAKPFLINSISLPIIGSTYLDATGANLSPLADLVADVVAAGANDAKLIVTAGVADRTDSNGYNAALLAGAAPSDGQLLAFAAQLRAQGLSVTWSPFFQVANTIAGSSATGQGDRLRPADFDAWMANHKAALVHQAELAQQAGAARFVIVSDEIQQLLFETPRSDTARIAKWLDLVQAVRAVFKGEITSTIAVDGTIFNGGATHLGLIPEQIVASWDSIGIGLFPDPLTSKTNPSVAELTAAWSSNANGFNSIATLRGYAQQFGKKVWISDRAAHSFDGANINHGQILNSQAPLQVDQQEQADILDSLLRAFSLESGDWFAGVAIQNMNRLVDYTSGVARYLDSAIGENIQDKLAEGVVTAWFSGQRQGAGVTREGSSAADRLDGGYHHDTLRGGGGNDVLNGYEGTDVAVYAGNRSGYTVSRTASGFTVADKSGAEGTDTLAGIERLQFKDKSVNLAVAEAARGVSAAQLDSLIELYIAYINRVPDADGMAYWIGQLKAGQSLQQIGEAFYGAALQFSAQTGYSAAMGSGDFVRVVYRNVLGRSEPDAEGLAYWSQALDSGAQSRGNLVAAMLGSAHTFKGHAQFGYVADLLDNKIAVGRQFAIAQGLVYNTSEDSITEGMKIAAAVTPASIAAAITLIGASDSFTAA